MNNGSHPNKTKTILDENLASKPSNIYVLPTGNPLHNTINSKNSIQLENDIATLTATKLNKKYGGAYSSWKNMKQRKKTGAIIDPRFAKFSSFLSLMGDRPSPDYTLDRIENDNKTYSPVNCRWADKHTQNSNKGNNVYLTHDGETLTVAQWAKKTKQKPDTLYKRHTNGWTPEEVITGVRDKTNAYLKTRPWPNDNAEHWEYSYASHLTEHDTSPFEYYILVCHGQLSEYEGLSEEARDSPYFDMANATPTERWNLEAYNLWYDRLQLAKTFIDYDNKLEAWESLAKKRDYTPSIHFFHEANPKPDLCMLQNLAGGLTKDKPVS